MPVMIYGQSGGGSKGTCLMGMPSASGLFHRASVQSGGGGNIPGTEQSRELARQLMKELGLESLQKMEWAKLNAAGKCCHRETQPVNPSYGRSGTAPSGTPRIGWSPTVGGRIVTLRSFYDAAPEISKNVPMLAS
jgi:para-nitrobenzyl esterase